MKMNRESGIPPRFCITKKSGTKTWKTVVQRGISSRSYIQQTRDKVPRQAVWTSLLQSVPAESL